MFGPRFADGWVERSTSSGSLCVEGEEVGSVVGGGSLARSETFSSTTLFDEELGKQITKPTG